MTTGVLDTARSARWLAASAVRRSRRSYDGTRVPDSALDSLATLAGEFRPFPSARAVLVREALQALFAGIIGAYGGISDAPSAIVLLGADGTDAEEVGYTGQGLVLEATALGLDTCWVRGLFNSGHAARVANATSGERVFAVCAVGHARANVTLKERVLSGGAHAGNRRPDEEIAPGYATWPDWARAAVEAVRCAPSAMNKQPWRLRMEAGRLIVGFEPPERPRISKRLDCGIAMLHAEVAARAGGVTGSWQSLASPDVAAFTAADVPTS